MASDVIVRAATVDDVELLHRFSVDLATFEDEPDAVTSTPQTLARDGFGENPQFAALIAERAGKPVGFALYTFNYSVWTAARGIFIEDIWVVPEERRGGVARALMAGLARECRAKGYKRIDLNELARGHLRAGDGQCEDQTGEQASHGLATVSPARRRSGDRAASS